MVPSSRPFPPSTPTLEGAAKSTLGKLQHDLSALRGKVISAAKKRDETLRRQFFRAQAPGLSLTACLRNAPSAASRCSTDMAPALVQTLDARISRSTSDTTGC